MYDYFIDTYSMIGIYKAHLNFYTDFVRVPIYSHKISHTPTICSARGRKLTLTPIHFLFYNRFYSSKGKYPANNSSGRMFTSAGDRLPSGRSHHHSSTSRLSCYSLKNTEQLEHCRINEAIKVMRVLASSIYFIFL